jgi:(1->4)-alpha-D-glucan 1-alpha-D-glucosylmutase
MDRDDMLTPRIPVSTYRLQFNRHFRFVDCKAIIAYLSDLGITDIYASPYFKAKEGSIHGYDIVDPNTFNPEVGTEEEYDEMIAQLHRHGMGQILDIVPNHMCVSSKDNSWWMDVLENGLSSEHAATFDIDWQPVKRELDGKVLLPILGDQYGKVLERGELKLVYEGGAFFVCYFEHAVPVRPKTYTLILTYRTEVLQELLDPSDACYAELLSIITALEHLPEYREVDPDKVAERAREKEIVKRRLRTLCEESGEIASFLQENIRIFNGTVGDPRSFDLMDDLLCRQVYRLAHWRVATEEINYRRFFDINSLGAIRMQDPRVFAASHGLILGLVKEGKVTGLRVDHPDGLYDPLEYFRRLQYHCFVQTRLKYVEGLKQDVRLPYGEPYYRSEIDRRYGEIVFDPAYDKAFYIVGEKILTKSERMPEEWPIFSTTGYVFLNSVNGIFIQMKHERALETIYRRFLKSRQSYQMVTYAAKRLIMEVSMSSEVNTLAHRLDLISERNRHTKDFTLNSLANAIKEVIAFFPVYRSYVNSQEVRERDRQYIELAVSKAKRRNPATSGTIFDFIQDVLLLRFPDGFDEHDKKLWLDFVMRFQQITGPVMAKGVEDTAFYVYNRLVSLNEVGGYPERFGTSLDTFHGQNIERGKFWPHALIATSTHDCKRSEDVRARINVLSEMPDKWGYSLILWSKANKGRKMRVNGQRVPDRNEEYLLYQTLVGTWPVGPISDGEFEQYKTRMKDYMLKAAREAKVNTSWINPNGLHEEALFLFVDSAMDPFNNDFLSDFIPFQRKVSCYGMYNSLSQLLIKITAPGVPDFYQGTEIWTYTLVDPDNRSPVNFPLLEQELKELRTLETGIGTRDLARLLTDRKEDGRIKMYTTQKALSMRTQHRAVFEQGKYMPLFALGDKENNVCAFARQHQDTTAITIVPRFPTGLVENPEKPPLGPEVWGNTFLSTPLGTDRIQFQNIFTGESLNMKENGSTPGFFLHRVFSHFPVALLESVD